MSQADGGQVFGLHLQNHAAIAPCPQPNPARPQQGAAHPLPAARRHSPPGQ
ncbi:MAG: hypothetical protein MZV64_02305 [Ignavibacteriales bacterium]|nr:hypothetical protein [Ignavibacteriales bacterium]